MAKKISVLGSTGSIGVQALDVIREQGYEVSVLAAGSNAALLAQQVAEFRPTAVAVANPVAAAKLEDMLAGMPHPPQVYKGEKAASLLAGEIEADIVLNAIVGIAGLSSTLAALNAGIDVALANKESLVTGGAIVMQAAAETGAKLLPVDSEHSAIFQCLQDKPAAQSLSRILLTASGGPFYGKKNDELTEIKAEDALTHPNWSMGAKITVDSASLMNKGLEFIEAMWLFDVVPENIQIVVQRESIIHSMVELADGSVLAQLGAPDMRIPIQYALTWPSRLPGNAPKLDFTQLTKLHFGQPDEEVFRCLAAAKKAAHKGGLAACAVNGANEQAVELFLQGEIAFLEIGRLVEACVDADSYAGGYSLRDVYACDAQARQFVRDNMRKVH